MATKAPKSIVYYTVVDNGVESDFHSFYSAVAQAGVTAYNRGRTVQVRRGDTMLVEVKPIEVQNGTSS